MDGLMLANTPKQPLPAGIHGGGSGDQQLDGLPLDELLDFNGLIMLREVLSKQGKKTEPEKQIDTPNSNSQPDQAKHQNQPQPSQAKQKESQFKKNQPSQKEQPKQGNPEEQTKQSEPSVLQNQDMVKQTTESTPSPAKLSKSAKKARNKKSGQSTEERRIANWHKAQLMKQGSGDSSVGIPQDGDVSCTITNGSPDEAGKSGTNKDARVSSGEKGTQSRAANTGQKRRVSGTIDTSKQGADSLSKSNGAPSNRKDGLNSSSGKTNLPESNKIMVESGNMDKTIPSGPRGSNNQAKAKNGTKQTQSGKQGEQEKKKTEAPGSVKPPWLQKSTERERDANRSQQNQLEKLESKSTAHEMQQTVHAIHETSKASVKNADIPTGPKSARDRAQATKSPPGKTSSNLEQSIPKGPRKRPAEEPLPPVRRKSRFDSAAADAPSRTPVAAPVTAPVACPVAAPVAAPVAVPGATDMIGRGVLRENPDRAPFRPIERPVEEYRAAHAKSVETAAGYRRPVEPVPMEARRPAEQAPMEYRRRPVEEYDAAQPRSAEGMPTGYRRPIEQTPMEYRRPADGFPLEHRRPTPEVRPERTVPMEEVHPEYRRPGEEMPRGYTRERILMSPGVQGGPPPEMPWRAHAATPLMGAAGARPPLMDYRPAEYGIRPPPERVYSRGYDERPRAYEEAPRSREYGVRPYGYPPPLSRPSPSYPPPSAYPAGVYGPAPRTAGPYYAGRPEAYYRGEGNYEAHYREGFARERFHRPGNPPGHPPVYPPGYASGYYGPGTRAVSAEHYYPVRPIDRNR